MAVATVDEVIGRESVIWAFGPDIEPVVEVEPGAVVRFETNDCFSGQIRSEDDLVTGIDMDRINSATGPVAVKGAEPGDSLVAEILEVNPIEWGVATIIPGYGQLHEQVRSPVTKIFDVRDGWIQMDERIRFPARPMVGVVGVATEGETLTNALPGEHGGNLDNHMHGPGARILFPVRQPGGMFAVGDMHASMGDGEICGTGVEIAGEVRHPLRPREGKAGALAGHGARRPLGRPRHALRVHGCDAARVRGSRPDARGRVGLHDGGRLHLPLGRLRRRASRRRASRARASRRSPAS